MSVMTLRRTEKQHRERRTNSVLVLAASLRTHALQGHQFSRLNRHCFGTYSGKRHILL